MTQHTISSSREGSGGAWRAQSSTIGCLRHLGLDWGLSARKSLSFPQKFVQVTQGGLGILDAQGAQQLLGKVQENPTRAMAEAPSHPRREVRALEDKLMLG